mmetsp:Transcript_112338/g.175438  ORF Transcript_112338/g.175438 Transcript_112338/m.175438 type:complete len:248 (-) Transcript_112338:82-825(-)
MSNTNENVPTRSIQKKKLNGYEASTAISPRNSKPNITNTVVRIMSSSTLDGTSSIVKTSDKNNAMQTETIVTVCQTAFVLKNLRTLTALSELYQPPRVVSLKPEPSAHMPISIFRCVANCAMDHRTSKLRLNGSSTCGLQLWISLMACCSVANVLFTERTISDTKRFLEDSLFPESRDDVPCDACVSRADWAYCSILLIFLYLLVGLPPTRFCTAATGIDFCEETTVLFSALLSNLLFSTLLLPFSL